MTLVRWRDVLPSVPLSRTAPIAPLPVVGRSDDATPCRTCEAGCCRGFALVIEGYDAYRLARDLALPLDTFVTLGAAPHPDEDHRILLDARSVPTRYHRLLLREVPDAHPLHPRRCMFLVNTGPLARCGVYAHRPSMCRLYPSSFDGETVHVSPGRYCPTAPWETSESGARELRAWHRFQLRQRRIYHCIADGWSARVLGARATRTCAEMLDLLAEVYTELERRRPTWFAAPADGAPEPAVQETLAADVDEALDRAWPRARRAERPAADRAALDRMAGEAVFELCRAACPACGATVEQSAPASLDGSLSPAQREAILGGRFLRVECATCGASSRPVPHPILYTDVDRQQWIAVFPAAEEAAWRRHEGAAWASFTFTRDHFRVPAELTAGFVVRTVFGVEALAEKLVCLEADLDDAILEVFKLDLPRPGPAGSVPRLVAASASELSLAARLQGAPPARADATIVRPRAAYEAAAADPSVRAAAAMLREGHHYVDARRILEDGHEV